MIDPSTLQAFASTIIRFEHDQGVWLLVPDDNGTGRLGQLNVPFHVISPVWSHPYPGEAHPAARFVRPDGAFMVRRHLDMEEQLLLGTGRYDQAVGFAPDLTYGELCFAVRNIRRPDACALGRRFQQLALFEVDLEVIRIIDCLSGEVVGESRFNATLLEFRHCAMQDPQHPDLDVEGCEPPEFEGSDAVDAEQWVLNWQRRYALLGCDVCQGCIGEEPD